jgi:hypothetical protein
MNRLRVGHVRHGRALFALRLPDIRQFMVGAHLDELCECDSLVSLHLEKLYDNGAPGAEVEEYVRLRRGIEDDACYYAERAAA